MELTARTLENPWVRLEPMADRHREGLREAVEADAAFFAALYPYSWAGEHFEPTWRKLITDVGKGETLAFAVVVGGACRGLTTYYGIDRANAVVEIGGTFYHPAIRGGLVNPSAKRLLLAHAFDSGVRRAVFRVDALNQRSRAAVLKLGAVQEGLLRQDRVTWTGRVRDTVIFSILVDDWPAVRDRLDARLGV
jgi:N-acetyltransferase